MIDALDTFSTSSFSGPIYKFSDSSEVGGAHDGYGAALGHTAIPQGRASGGWGGSGSAAEALRQNPYSM